ncbi:MAG: pyridoxamine 5'-phosphate oxidase family protein [Nostoc sp. ChiSLP02]|nr:pyridoxamine 5'-phosphate oxidase family protein [Nostoc sp. DedSLP05]MDZ8098630.1 pyridoxamine 5'-phosphate oxidase family protein [Nostoc sp. DedSLP01]MDZ8183758.1 pyridoxamine 5'-phosphate oxidase family protein [Nostoc sp. ChiSLP02]
MLESASVRNRWVNTIDFQNPEVIAKAFRLLESNIYCTVSTCSFDGYPWVSPLFFAYDDRCNIYWSSAIESKHSQNLYSNDGKVAIAIFNSHRSEGTAEGLYFSGTASELKPEDTEKILKLLLNRAQRKHNRTVDDYLNDSPRRIYQFQPQEAWVTGERLPVDNQLIDTKIQICLQSLRQHVKS